VITLPVVAELSILPRVGETVDRYRVVAEVAHGGMAAVYAVQRSSIGGFEKLLALKVMLPHLASDEHFVAMFLDEARIASMIQHPNVVQVLDVGLHERRPFILMEFLRGQSLSQLIQKAQKRGEAVPARVAMAILAQVAEGLHAAHETAGSDDKPLGIVHRDVTPHNVFVGYDGRVKVVDFGVAAARGRLGGTRTGEVKGKLAYLSPEQFDRSWPVTRAADLWALGVIGWEIFSGRRLFASGDEATTIWNVLNAPVEPLRRLAPELPPAAAEALTACLSREPGRRPATARAVAQVLSAALEPNAALAEIAGVMECLFAAERAQENQRFARSPDGDRAPESSDPTTGAGALVTRSEGSAATQLSSASAVRASKRSRLGGAAVIALLALGVAVFLLGYGRRKEPAAPEPSTTVPAPPADSRIRVTVRIDPKATLARVNGTRHDERPLELKLAPNEGVEVEVTAADGAVVRRTVRSHDDGILIAFEAAPPSAEPRSKAPPRRAGERAPKPEAKSKSPLLKNPF
jgi:eukaryotic-like serine/threonine-protein kinase